MKKTYVTKMPDKVGSFLLASEIMSSLGLNITRVSYNRAVDTHVLFIEVEGDAEAIAQATGRLESVGYILEGTDMGNMMLIDFILPDVPGSVLPVLRLINSYHFNISYISSQADGSGVQRFRMGFLIENRDEVSDFLKKASAQCEIQIISYNQCEQVLDNTVFYLSFANWISAKISMTGEQKMNLIVDSNLIMELLRDQPDAQYETFSYIRRFAENLCGDRVIGQARVTRFEPEQGLTITLIEPPCGSNTCLLETGEGLIAIDGGFHCFQSETLSEIKKFYPDFETRPRRMILSHADVDHCGLADCFDVIYASELCCRNFESEAAGRGNLREANPLHAPYVRISKLLSRYRTPDTARLISLGRRTEGCADPLEQIGTLSLFGLTFECHEGAGGHVAGEIILIERSRRLVFTGDIFINIKDCIPAQREFNRLAPYLMTSVDTRPDLARAERGVLMPLLGPGKWLIFGGHGAAKAVELD